MKTLYRGGAPSKQADLYGTRRSSAVWLLCAVVPLVSCSSPHTSPIPIDLPSFEGSPSELDPGTNPPTPFIRKVLVVAIDGLRASKLDNTDGHLLDIPNFESMQADGIFVYESHQERMPNGKYETCPGFIQMTTGKRIGAHGVRDNSECADGDFASYPLFFKRLKELRPAIRIAVADPTGSFAHIAVQSCGGVTNLGSCMDAYYKFDKSAAGDIDGRDKVLEWIAGGNYHLVWYHPHEIDAEGHSSGWDDDPYNNLVEEYDRVIIGPLLAAVATREESTLERWMIVTTADHGGHNVLLGWWGAHDTRAKDRRVPIIVSGSLIPDEGDQGPNAFNTWDLPATIYRYFGLTPNSAWPATDGVSIIE